MRVKQESSSTSLGNEEGLDTQDRELFVKYLAHLSTCLQNPMKNINQCEQCPKIIPNILQILDKFRSSTICEDCGELACGYYDYPDEVCIQQVDQENIKENSLPPKHMSIRLSFSKSTKIKNCERQIEPLNRNIQNTSDELTSIQDKLQDLLKLKQEMEDLHYATYDGSFTWPIKEFKEKFAAAESEQETSIDSPVFYSSSNGYKMRVRLYLYGDGNARGTHMSVFLVTCPGKFDPILQWPFNFHVTFCLFDQTKQGNNVVDSFSPGAISDSFQQTHSEDNTVGGILKFLPLAVLQRENDYVLNDTMYIQVTVGSSKTPRPVLPYTLSINPGLPPIEQHTIQSRMIEQHNQVEVQLSAQIREEDQEVVDHSLIPEHPIENLQQPASSTTDSDCTSCEDKLHQS